MENKEQISVFEYRSLIGQKKQTIFVIVLIFLVVSTILTFIQPFKYASETKLLIIQNFPPNQDPYTASKSNEYLSSLLAQVITTNSFFNEVVTAGFNIDKTYFPKENNKLMRVWKKVVKADSVYDTGMINITVFHKDKYQSDQILRAVNNVLQTKHKLYHGVGDELSIKVLDQPTISDKPVRPNIPLNILVGLVIGFVSALLYIYIFPEEEYDLNFTKKRKIKKIQEIPEVPVAQPSSEPALKHETYYPQDNGGYATEHMSQRQINHYQSIQKKVEEPKKEKVFKREEAAVNSSMNDDLDYEEVMKKGSMENIVGR